MLYLFQINNFYLLISTTDFYIHKMNDIDDLFSLAKRLKIHPVDLNSFHNERCKPSESILFDYYYGIEKKLVPINYK